MRGPTYPHAGTRGPSLEQLSRVPDVHDLPQMPTDYKKAFESQARGVNITAGLLDPLGALSDL